MQTNPNNPQPQGYGAAFFAWVASNIQFIKRRMNALATNGGGGGSQNLQSVTDIGNSTSNAVVSKTGASAGSVLNNGTTGSYSGDSDPNGGGSTSITTIVDDMGTNSTISFSRKSGAQYINIIPNGVINGQNVISLPNATGTVALVETTTLQQVTDAGNTTSNVIHVSNIGDAYLDSTGLEVDDADGTRSISITPQDPQDGIVIVGIVNDKTTKLKFPSAPSANILLNLPTIAGTLARIEDLTSGYVPYTGAISNIDVNNQQIKNVATPTGMQDATNKAYVDTFVQGLSPKTAVRLATAAALPTGTYNNGASGVGATFTVTATGTLTVDGVLTALNDRILVKDQASQLQNGIYQVTTAGAVGVAAVLTRTTDADQGTELVSAYVITGTEGTLNASKGYVQATPSPITMGTTAIVWNLFNSNTLAPGSGIRITGNTIYNRLAEGFSGGQSVIGGTAADDSLTVQGSTSVLGRTTTSPAIIMNSAGYLGASGSTAQTHLSIPVTVNQSGTAGYSALKVAVSETATGSGTKNLLELNAGTLGTTNKVTIANTGTTTWADGANFVLGTSTGTKIGTSTSQKIGFFNATPVAQQTGDVITALQNLGLGTSLTITPSSGSGGLIGIRTISSGTTSYTPTSGCTAIVAILVAGGGGGGGAKSNGAGFMAVGTGGGSGSVSTVYSTVSSATTYTCAVGTGGSGGAGLTPSDGTSGGDTSLTIGGTTYISHGGSGGKGGPVTSSTITFIDGGAGGAVGVGTITSPGASGGIAFTSGSVPKGYSGAGADCQPYGIGGRALLINSAGTNAAGFGSGGSGAFASSTTNQTGGNGANGIIVIYEYR